MKMILQKDENLVYEQQPQSNSFCKKIDSKSAFFNADMTYLMSNFHDFDDDQIFWKFAQR